MKKSITGKLSVVLLSVILGACATGGGTTGGDITQTMNTGFLRDYSSLQPAKDPMGNPIRLWVSPKFTPARYDAVLLDPLVFYPEPRPTAQVSAEVLQQILVYANAALKRSLGERFKMVDRAGPGVVRIRCAYTGLAAQGEGIQPYELLPIGLAATMAVRSVRGTPQQVFIVGECEATDSVTGELLAERVRVGTGQGLAKLAEQPVVTLDTVKPLLDELSTQAAPFLGLYVKTK